MAQTPYDDKVKEKENGRQEEYEEEEKRGRDERNERWHPPDNHSGNSGRNSDDTSPWERGLGKPKRNHRKRHQKCNEGMTRSQ